jgi:hypothetical protein
MNRILRITLLLLMPPLCIACIKEEPKNNECDILSAWVEGAEYESYFYLPSQMRIDHVASNSNEIVFEVRSKTALPPLPLFFTLTPGATVVPASGSLQDFSHGPVTYTVTSEDGEWTRTYRVDFRTASSASSRLFSFEHVAEDTLAIGCRYHLFYEVDDEGSPQAIWASGNAGVAILHSDWTPEQFPTYSLAEGQQGRGVCLNTQSTGSLGAAFGKPIAAGNLFLGKFNVNAVFADALKATEFGIPTDRQPVKVSGWYKYRPGDTFTNAAMETVPDRVDQCHLYAVFYRNQDAEGNPVVLYGDNVLSSDLIVSKAQLTPPAVEGWTHFEMAFEGGTADPAILAARGYSFTVVFSSSKNGDTFEGAIGSTLCVDEVEVEFGN